MLNMLLKLSVFCSCLVLLISCHQKQSSSFETELKQLKLTAFFSEQPLDCNLSFEHKDATWFINSLGFYYSNFEIFSSNADDWQPVSLEQNEWQNGNTGLVWFSSGCDSPNKPSNTEITFYLPDEYNAIDVTHLRFAIGVPFQRNHLNPLIQPSPLNIPEMFWSWQNGYKFMRLDMQSASEINWSFHLGSTGCESPSSVRSPESPCKSPNVFSFSMPVDLNGDSVIKFELDALLEQVDLNASTQCMFNLDELLTCKMLMENMFSNTLFTSSLSAPEAR